MNESLIPTSPLSAFLRRHTHDMRNDLNALELELALLKELSPEGEAQECVARMSRQARLIAERMKALSARFQDPLPFASILPAHALFVIWQERCEDHRERPDVRWDEQLGDQNVEVDAGMMAAVFNELLCNAASFCRGPITVSARPEGTAVFFEMREPQEVPLDTQLWGRPFYTTRTGHDGLGLWTARRMIAANQAEIAQRYLPEDSVLLTRITIPQAR